MARKITVRLITQFEHKGEMYARYQRQDNGACTDVKIMARSGVVLYSAIAARAEAERRLRSGRRWAHPHLVR